MSEGEKVVQDTYTFVYDSVPNEDDDAQATFEMDDTDPAENLAQKFTRTPEATRPTVLNTDEHAEVEYYTFLKGGDDLNVHVQVSHDEKDESDSNLGDDELVHQQESFSEKLGGLHNDMSLSGRFSESTIAAQQLQEVAQQEVYELKKVVDEKSKQQSGKQEWYILMPDDWFRYFWDIAILFMLGWISVILPLQIAFEDELNHSRMKWIIYVDRIIDGLFLVDMILTCFTAKHGDDGVLMVKVGQLTRTYVRSPYFYIDLVAIIPYSDIYEAMSSVKVLKFAKQLRFIRVFKFIRLRKLNDQLDKLDLLNPMIPIGTFRLIKIFTALAVFAHFMGCIFYAVGTASDTSWFPDGFESEPYLTQYFTAVYWAVTTLTTVGYGDIGPVNENEVAVAMITMLIGAISFSIVTATVSSMINRDNQNFKTYRRKVDGAEKFIQENKKLPPGIQEEMRKLLKLKWMKKYENKYDMSKIEEIYKTLPQSFLKQLVYHVNKEMFKCSDLLKSIARDMEMEGQNLVLDMFILFRRRDVSPKETICIKGELCKHISFIQHGLFVVLRDMKGQASFGNISDTTKSHSRKGSKISVSEKDLVTLKKGECIGLEVEYCDELGSHPAFPSRQRNTNVVSVISQRFGMLRYLDIQKFRDHDFWNKCGDILKQYASRRLQQILDSESSETVSPRKNHENRAEFSVDRWLRVVDIRLELQKQEFYIENQLTLHDIVEMKIVDDGKKEQEVDVHVRYNSSSLLKHSRSRPNYSQSLTSLPHLRRDSKIMSPLETHLSVHAFSEPGPSIGTSHGTIGMRATRYRRSSVMGFMPEQDGKKSEPLIVDARSEPTADPSTKI